MRVEVSDQASTLHVLSRHYTNDFYAARAEGSQRSAEAIVPLILGKYPIKSVIDVGCGTGTWLRVFAGYGISNIHGVDGNHVDRSTLRIPPECFTAADLSKPTSLQRRFDLAICMEVAEHLPASSAASLVESLKSLANVVLFSAAIPGQGGTNHVNEQWPDYWAAMFKARGYEAIDCIRPLIWNVPEVDWWYAQNAIVFATPDVIAANPKLAEGQLYAENMPMRLIHPRCFTIIRNTLESLREHSWTPGVAWCSCALGLSIRNAIRRRLPQRVKRSG